MESRTLLTADPLAGLSALYDNSGLSMRSMLASCAGQTSSGNAGSAQAPAASSSTNNSGNSEPGATTLSIDVGAGLNEPSAQPLDSSLIMEYRLAAEDMNGNVITTVQAGQDYQLVAFVHDIRNPAAQFGGVFAGFLNVSYNPALSTSVSTSPSFTNQDGSAGFYTLTPSGNLATAGQITGAGAAATSSTNPGPAEKLLWRVTMHATGGGTQTFTPSFDNVSGHETLMYGLDDAVTSDQIQFDTLTLQVGSTPTASIANVSQTEGNTGNTNFIFTVTLSNPTSQIVTIPFSTTDGTATSAAGSGQDYVAQNGTLTFAANQTTQQVTIQVKGDVSVESDETFNVVLGTPVNATIAAGAGSAVGTILNDDTPQIGITGVSQNEGDTQNAMVFTVTISHAVAENVLVPFTTQGGTATSGTDFTATSGTLTFTGGSATSQLITVLINGDTDNEPNEDFLVKLTQPANATFDTSNGQATGTIVNDDGPHISFTQTQVTHDEGNSGTTDYVFTVDIGEASATPVTVVFNTANGTATAGSDYTATNGTLTFNPGDPLTQNITVHVTGDLLNEADETFTLNLSNPTGATLTGATATGTITNDDVAPSLSFSNPTVSLPEGNQGTSQMFFTVTLSAASGQTVTVQYSTANVTAATTDSDYQATSGTLTFAPGQTQQVIAVTINSDTKHEADETFSVNLFNSVNAANAVDIATQLTATGTITNDDAVPTISVADVSHNEGNTGTTAYVFTVSLSNATDQQVTVAFGTQDGTATLADSDYVASSGTLTFAAGETTKLVTINVNGDTRAELNETFSLNLSSPSAAATIADGAAQGTLVNDDDLPTLSIGNVALSEGNSGTTNFVFTVTLSAASGQDVTVGFTTTDGTATTTNGDYVGQAGTITFAAGTTTQTITVAVNGDVRNEADESFQVTLANAANATIAVSTGSGLIINDDPVPSVSISNPAAVNEGDSGTTPVVFQVNLSAVSGQQVTVVYTTADGTALISNGDYVATSGTLTFAAGVTTQSLTVLIKGDLFQEQDETFKVNLTNPVNGTLGTAQGIGTIHSESTDTVVSAPSKLSGLAFIDVNGNGVRDGNESLLSGLTGTLTGTSSVNGQSVTRSVTVNSDGTYSVTGLDPGTYTVSFNQLGGDFQPAIVKIGSQGGTPFSTSSAAGFTTTIPLTGGVDGTNNVLTTPGLQASKISSRIFLSSAQGGTINVGNGASSLAVPQASPAAAVASAEPGAVPAALMADEVSVTQNGSVVTVRGTSGDDQFQFIAGSTDTVVINGQTFHYDPSQVTAIVFDGLGGDDSASLTGSAGDDFASVGMGFGTLIGSNYNVTVSNVKSLSINGGGGNDSAVYQDSASNDQLQAVGSSLSASNDLNQTAALLAFDRVHAISNQGGHDTIHSSAVDYALEQEGSWTAA